ncbi:MAG: protein kinase [Ferruginibacter sp.]
MATITTTSIHDDFLKAYNIEREFKPSISCGQKKVHFVIREKVPMVLKLFHYGRDERFDREMKIYTEFQSIDGIPKIIKIDEYHGQVFVFEEFIEGDTLSDIIINYKNDPSLIINLMKNIFQILHPIWTANYVHRDLKPENIIIKTDGTPVILDFGIARDLSDSTITPAGFQPHSWPWASPEQYEGIKDLISYRTDFFSLGLIAYYLFYQQRPFGNTKDEIEKKFKSGIETFDIEENCPLKVFCTRLMQFSPASRPRKIEDALNLL